jgi:hypothetical protein
MAYAPTLPMYQQQQYAGYMPSTMPYGSWMPQAIPQYGGGMLRVPNYDPGSLSTLSSEISTAEQEDTSSVPFSLQLRKLQNRHRQGCLAPKEYFTQLIQLIRVFPEQAAEPDFQAILNEARREAEADQPAVLAGNGATPTRGVTPPQTRLGLGDLERARRENKQAEDMLQERQVGLALNLAEARQAYDRKVKGLDLVLVMDGTGTMVEEQTHWPS